MRRMRTLSKSKFRINFSDLLMRAVISTSLTRTDFYVEVLVTPMLNLRIEMDEVT